MSRIIKRGKFAECGALETYQPPALRTVSPENCVRSLQFVSIVQEEIGECTGKFSMYRTRHAQKVALEVEQSYDTGYGKGIEDGVNREKADRITAIDTLLSEAKRKQEQAIRDMEVKVVELAIYIAQRIIGNRIEADPEIVTNIIREVMSNIVSGETVILKVCEEDLALVNARYDQWLGMAGNAREFRIEADRRLRRGDCTVETEGGIIDSVVANRLDCLVDALLKR